MASDRFQGGLNLLGQALSAPASPVSGNSKQGEPVHAGTLLPSTLLTANAADPAGGPQLAVPWGEFRQGIGSSIRALFTRTRALTNAGDNFFKDSRIERRIPRQAIVVAALWHIAFIILPPFPGMSMTPRRNPALDNFQLTWSGPIEDLPLLKIPKQGPKPVQHTAKKTEVEQPAVDAFHPRQRIFTDPVKPTHLRQTLINPKAPFEPPKLLPDLPNMVQLEAVAPPRPRLLISEETLKKLHPKERRVKTVTAAPPLDAPNMEQHVTADLSLPATQSGPARPKLEINSGAAPRVAQRAQSGDAGPAPDVAAGLPNPAGSSASTLIALSATPGPPAPVAPPQGNLAARVAISPEGPRPGGSDSTSGGGKSPVGVSISGGNPKSDTAVSGLGTPAPKITLPSAHALMSKPQPKIDDDVTDRVGPPNFAALPPGAKPEVIFSTKRVYSMNVNMPNLNSSTGSWILNFSELRSNPDAPHVASSDLGGPVPLKKVDPKYPPALISERVEGEVILYAVIRRDGSVDSIQIVKGIDEQLDANSMSALAQWKFRPATKQGEPVELEAIVHIPFRLPSAQ
jgi:TonB family protein